MSMFSTSLNQHSNKTDGVFVGMMPPS